MKKNITVHLGKPAASARNVTVSFRSYIANVASSEVYPTWPEQALRANIHCQISLALNRIYTEWYPSKGYSFNITHSPLAHRRQSSLFSSSVGRSVDVSFTV